MEPKENQTSQRIHLHFTKPPSWLFYILITLFSTILAVYLLWQYTPIKDELETQLIRRLQPYLGESFYITDFSVGTDNISFYNVRAADIQAGYMVEFGEIRFSFNLSSLITYNFDPLKTINEIDIIAPQVTIFYQDTPRETEIKYSLEQIFEEIVTNLKQIPEIDYLTIRNGRIVLQMPWQAALAEKQIPLFSSLNGRVDYLASDEEVTLALDGAFLGAEKSMIRLTGYVDFGEKRSEATVSFDESYVTSSLPFWKLNFWKIANARLKGSVQVINEHFDSDSLVFSGDVMVKDMDMLIYGQHAQADSFFIRFNGRDALIDTFDCRVEDGNARFGGVISNLLSPEVDWQLLLRDYSVKHLVQSHSIFEYTYEGKMSGTANFSGPFNSLDIHAEARVPKLLYAVVPFNTVYTSLDYNTREKVLRFPYLRADFFEFQTRGTGNVNFNNDTLTLDLASGIDVPSDYFSLLTGLNGGTVTVDTDFYGNFRSKTFRGGFVYRGQGADTLLASGRGPFTLDDQLMRFSVRSDDDTDDFSLSGTIHQLFSGPRIEILDFRDFPVAQLSYNPFLKAFLDGRHTNVYFSGPYHSLAVKLKVVPEDEPLRQIVQGTGSISDIFLENQRFQGVFMANTAPRRLNGRYDVAFSPEGMKVLVDAPGLFKVDIYRGFRDSAPYEGQVRLKNAALQDFLVNSPVWSKVLQKGNLEGQLDISGIRANPRVRFQLAASDLVINNVGYYNALLSGGLQDQLMNLDNLWLKLNSDTVINADFSWFTDTDAINLRVKGRDLESNFIAETIFGDPQLIQGQLSYQLNADGTMSKPLISARMNIGEGDLLGDHHFHSIELAVEDSLVENGRFWQPDHHMVNIRNFLYRNHNVYDLRVRGSLGIEEYLPLDLQVDASGNVLAELPRLFPYFQNPIIDGRLFARIKGTRSNPFLDQLDLRIYDGTMSFAEVLPTVNKLNVSVKLTDGSDFIHIETLEGMINGRWARLSNTPTVALQEGGFLEPWYFEEIGLNFGILTLETAENGIPLHFPGMMEEGDIGYFTASGRYPGEKFYVAGPPELPICRGTTTLYNCRVTFPFIGMYDESGVYAYAEDDKVIEFLMNMRWDLLSLPGNNNRYFVSVPAYVGDVIMDLNIDNNSEGLVYSGRLVDESFRADGSVVSSRGRVEYLDVNFRVERFGAEFNTYEIYPEVYGTAYTTVRTEQYDPVFGIDTTSAAVGGESVPRDILLRLYVTDPVTGKEVSKGRWEDFRFKLLSRENPYGETQELLLAHLGYSFRNLQYKAGEVGLTLTQNFLIRPLFRPIERQLERKLHLDYVRVRSNFASYLLYLSFQDHTQIFNRPTFMLVNNNLDPALQLLQSSELTLGKYVLNDVYMTYTGQLVAGVDDSKLGVNHSLGLEYRLLYNLLLEVEMSMFQFDPFYDTENGRDLTRDLRFRLRHSINF